MAGICSRVVPSTRRYGIRLAAVGQRSVCPIFENRKTRPAPALPTTKCHSLRNERGGGGGHASVSSSNRTSSHPRFLSSGPAYLEDADNVYFEGLLERIKIGDVQMIDVRDQSELDEFGTIIKDVCHIPVLDVEAALKLPDGEYRAKYGHPKPGKTDDNIVFTCKKGIRSLTARDTARELGFTKARHYPGGWREWGRMNNLPYPKE